MIADVSFEATAGSSPVIVRMRSFSLCHAIVYPHPAAAVQRPVEGRKDGLQC